jgi:hypothetical protein
MEDTNSRVVSVRNGKSAAFATGGSRLPTGESSVLHAVANRNMWAAQGETPLITACPGAKAKTSEKWANGAVIWPDGAGALVEIKAIPASQPRRIRAVVSDLAALIAVDWPATLERPRSRCRSGRALVACPS